MRYLILDRDGTVNEERHYLSDPDELALLPGVGAALRRFRDAGWGLIVVTNQSGIARGYFSAARLAEIHERLAALLAAEGLTLAGIYHCPHAPADGCACRKPRPGLVEQARRDLGCDPRQAIVVGDKPADLGLARAVGATAVLVRTGHGHEYADDPDLDADFVAADLAELADWVLGPE